VGLTAACRGSIPPPPPPDEIIAGAAARLQGITGVHFVIDRTGAPAYLDPGNTLSLRRAEGDFVAPDRARAVVRVIAPGLVTEISVISVAEIQWETNVLTGEWEELPPDWGFNPAVLFDAEVGLQSILATDLTEVEFVETQKIEDGPDEQLYHLQGRVGGEKLFRVSGGLIGPQPMAIELWVAPETFELYRVVLTEPEAGADEPSIWQVDLSRFDQVVEIAPPDLNGQ